MWLQVKDQDEWVPCSCSHGGVGKTKLTRMYAPHGVRKEVEMADEEVLKMRPVVGDVHVPGSDLVWLEDVHDSTMLHNLRLRYEQDKIYSAIGPALLAINPYKPVKTPEFEEGGLNMAAGEVPHCNKTGRAAYAGLLEGSTPHKGSNRRRV